MRIENSYYKEDMIGVVNRGEHLPRNKILKKGNVQDEQRMDFNNLNLNEMAQASEFLEPEQTKQALVEIIDKDFSGDFKNPLHFRRNLSGTFQFPYKRTFTGFVQPYNSEKELNLKTLFFTALGVGCLLI